MTRVEAIEKAERLRLLVAYANAWRTAHREYRVELARAAIAKAKGTK